MTALACLTEVQLREFAVGNLTEEESSLIETHLDACPVCERSLAAFDGQSDSLLDHLKSPRVPSRYADDPAYCTARRRLESVDLAHADGSQPERLPPADLARLGDYEILEVVGFGGMGAVYRGRHTRLNRPVAIKVLPERRMRDAAAVARFQREMRAIGQLDHPSIVRATDAGEIGGTHYLVMELVDGIDLDRIVRRCGPLETPAACELVRQAACGIDHAHQRQMIHRDIKPSNLMLAGSERVKILDLGLALLSGVHGSVDELTTVGQLMGTLDYMAPEQCGNSHVVDARADVYALAATLYKLLSGRAPYGSRRDLTVLEKLTAIATEPVSGIQNHCEVPAELAAIINRSLSRNPDDRPASAADFAAALEPFADASGLASLYESALAAPDDDDPRDDPAVSARLAATGPGKPAAGIGTGVPAVEKWGGRSSSPWTWLAAALGAVLILVAGVIVYLETGKGKLTIHCAADDLAVTIYKAGRHYDELALTAGENSTRIGAGKYEIRIDGAVDGLHVENGSFELRRGDGWVARIVQTPSGATDAAAAPPPAASVVRYDGKTYEQWVGELRTDRSPARRTLAIDALATLGASGRAEETVNWIVTSLTKAEVLGEGTKSVSGWIAVLSRMDQRAITTVFRQTLRTGSSDARYVVVHYLRSQFAYGAPPEVAALAPDLLLVSRDGDPAVRRTAIDLVLIFDQQVDGLRRRLDELRKDPDMSVAVAAATNLVYVAPDTPGLAADLARIAFFQQESDIRSRSLEAIQLLVPRGAEAIPTLIEIVRIDNDIARFLPVAENLMPVRETVSSGIAHRSIQERAIETLAMFGPAAEAAIPALEDELARRKRTRHPPQALIGTGLSLELRPIEDALAKIKGQVVDSPDGSAADAPRAPGSRGPLYAGSSLEELIQENMGLYDLEGIRVLSAEADERTLAAAIDRWHRWLQREREPQMLAEAICVVAALGHGRNDRRVVEIILDTMSKRPRLDRLDDDRKLNYVAAHELQSLPDRPHVRQLMIEGLHEGNSAVRLFILRQHWLFADTKLEGADLAAVLQASSDPAAQVRQAALMALIARAEGTDDVLARERQLVDDPDWATVVIAGRALIEAGQGDQAVLDRLEAVAHEVPETSTCTAALHTIGVAAKTDPRAVAAIARLLEDPQWRPRPVEPLLFDRGDDNYQWPRYDALVILRDLGLRAAPARKAVESHLNHELEPVRKVARQVLDAIGQ